MATHTPEKVLYPDTKEQKMVPCTMSAVTVRQRTRAGAAVNAQTVNHVGPDAQSAEAR